MQEEVTQKTIALVFKSSRLTADVLKKAMKLYLEHRKAGKQATHGKISVKALVGQGTVAMSKVIEGIVKDLKAVPQKLTSEMKKVDKKKFILMNLPYVLMGYFCNKVVWLWRTSPGKNSSDKMLATMNGLEDLFSNPLPSFFLKDLLIGVMCGIIFGLMVYFKAKNAKKFRHGVEYGSARWGTAKDIKPYVDPEFENNVLLTETERLMMSGRPKEPKYARNKNILVIGGSGKTRFFVKLNLMQMHSSYGSH